MAMGGNRRAAGSAGETQREGEEILAGPAEGLKKKNRPLTERKDKDEGVSTGS